MLLSFAIGRPDPRLAWFGTLAEILRLLFTSPTASMVPIQTDHEEKNHPLDGLKGKRRAALNIEQARTK
jgi:hypothetical protein